MTTLQKIDTSNSIVLTRATESAQAVQGRQEIAAQGKTVPAARTVGVPAEEKKKELEQALKQVSGYVQNITRELNFSIDEELDQAVVTVLDQESGEVIRQMPTEEMLSLAKNISSMHEELSEKSAAKGILFRGDA